MLIEDVLTEFKRTHLEHIEDIVITDGYEGGKSVVEYFRGLLLTPVSYTHLTLPTILRV